MSYYETNAQFERNLALFFERMQVEQATAVQDILKKNLLIIIDHTDPDGTIVLDGRETSIDVSFVKPKERGDLYIKTSTETLHHVLLGDLRLAKAIGSRDLIFKGSLRKAMALADLFHACQDTYRDIVAQVNT